MLNDTTNTTDGARDIYLLSAAITDLEMQVADAHGARAAKLNARLVEYKRQLAALEAA